MPDGRAGADAEDACMAAIELPAALPLAPMPPDALFLHHTLQQRFRVEVRLSRPRSVMSAAAGVGEGPKM